MRGGWGRLGVACALLALTGPAGAQSPQLAPAASAAPKEATPEVPAPEPAERAPRRIYPRPAEAPLFGRAPELPPLPPEYLTREVEGMTIAFHPLGRDRVRALAEAASELRRRLSEELGHPVLGELTIRVAVGPSDVARIVPEGAPKGQEAIALFEASTLILALPSANVEEARVMASFRRGMAYLALDEAAGIDGLPRWLRTGYALRIATYGAPERSRALWWASVEERVIPVVDLDFYLEDGALDSVAAAESVDFVRSLSEGDRAEAFAHLMRRRRAGDAFEAAIAQAYQADLDQLEQSWRLDLARHRTFVPVLLGSLGLWGVLALVAVFAKRRRGRAEPELERDDVEAPPKPPRRRKTRSTPRVPIGAVEAAETEVPKVSHDGSWHTLH